MPKPQPPPSPPSSLTHLDAAGRAHMVDVGEKPTTARECIARGAVVMRAQTLAAICDARIAKGEVLATARLAAIQAAKRTAEWIPLAHPLGLDAIDVDLVADPGTPGETGRGEQAQLRIEARVRARARTGVEMEALVAVAAAGLTVYDMCKAIDREMCIQDVRLVRKSGGKSGVWERVG